MVTIRHCKVTEDYTIGDVLGRGKFSIVKECTHKRSGQVFAAKILRSTRRGCSQEAILSEAAIMFESRSCEQILRLVEVFNAGREFVLVEELASGGDLYRHCLAGDRHADEESVRHYIAEVLTALDFLHSNSIAHCDIKPENVLVTGPESRDVRLVDFGLARRISETNPIREIIGTTEYVAPEILAYEPITTACDMWSLGVLAYTLLSGVSPFLGDNDGETYSNIANADFDFEDAAFVDVSPLACDFITRLLEISPKCRPSAREALNHAWIRCESLRDSRASTPKSGGSKDLSLEYERPRSHSSPSLSSISSAVDQPLVPDMACTPPSVDSILEDSPAGLMDVSSDGERNAAASSANADDKTTVAEIAEELGGDFQIERGDPERALSFLKYHFAAQLVNRWHAPESPYGIKTSQSLIFEPTYLQSREHDFAKEETEMPFLKVHLKSSASVAKLRRLHSRYLRQQKRFPFRSWKTSPQCAASAATRRDLNQTDFFNTFPSGYIRSLSRDDSTDYLGSSSPFS